MNNNTTPPPGSSGNPLPMAPMVGSPDPTAANVALPPSTTTKTPVGGTKSGGSVAAEGTTTKGTTTKKGGGTKRGSGGGTTKKKRTNTNKKSRTGNNSNNNKNTTSGNANSQRNSSAAAHPSGTNAASHYASSSLYGNTVLESARLAERDLASARAEREARKSDAAWSCPERVAAVRLPEKGFCAERVVDRALRGVKVTPHAYGALLEYARRYAAELLEDAAELAAHRCGGGGNGEGGNGDEAVVVIQGRDLLAAVDLMKDSGGSGNYSSAQRGNAEELAEEVNRIPLPPIPPNCYSGVVLDESMALLGRTFDVLSSGRRAHQLSKLQQEQNNSNNNNDDTNKTSTPSTSLPSYGAHKGPQIEVHLKPKLGANDDMTTQPSSTNTDENHEVPLSSSSSFPPSNNPDTTLPPSSSSMLTF